ncbi:MAG: GNAT family N-acetyltransferase, partial [Bacteroidaceae bacterium]|nr:GNAT family N-acetyltransferase [Bacteroidaceae bacterium]
MIIVPYSIHYKEIWDDFARMSKNATFLLQRDFMDYHADRFFDCSLLIYEGELSGTETPSPDSADGLKALFPANWVEAERTVYSHQGLTYGGLVMGVGITQQEVLEIMQAVMRYYRDMLQAVKVYYKPIPYIYSPYPTGEDLYAIFRAGATLKCRGVSSVVALQHQLRMRTLRQRQAKKAIDNNFYIDRVMESDREGISQYWQILAQVLAVHNARPVHSEEEIQLLMSRFPREIRLFVVKRE